jgi:hypothetical protein
VYRLCSPAARFISASTLCVTLPVDAVLGLIYSLLQELKVPAVNSRAEKSTKYFNSDNFFIISFLESRS